jgi:hypothetical protein
MARFSRRSASRSENSARAFNTISFLACSLRLRNSSFSFWVSDCLSCVSVHMRSDSATRSMAKGLAEVFSRQRFSRSSRRVRCYISDMYDGRITYT